MSKRLLAVGSQTGGLSGVQNDIDGIADMLGKRGFQTRAISGAAACREGILTAYRELIDQCDAGDVAIFYYSGHGARVRLNEAAAADTVSSHLQFIVPTDIDESSSGDFRGILAEELSLLQWKLTEKTANVVTILDCCHSARMSRDASVVPKARLPVWPMEGIVTLWNAVRADPAARRMVGESNLLAVRLVACGPEQSAYEGQSAILGKRHGLLTESLLLLLSEIGKTPVTWAGLLEPLRRRVLDLGMGQRPEVEGPIGRYLFSLDEAATTGVFPIAVGSDGRAGIEAPLMLGPEVDDRFSIVASGLATEQAIGTGTVIEVTGRRAILRLELRPGAALPPDAEARPLRVALGRRAVGVEPRDHPSASRVVDVIRQCSYLRLGHDGDPRLATIQLDSDRMQLLDAQREPLGQPRPIDDGGLAALLRDTEHLARAARLRELTSGTGAERLAADVRVSWERVSNELKIALAPSGEHVFEGDRVRLHVQNASDTMMWVSVFDVGLRGAITQVTAASPSGVPILAGETLTIPLTPAGEPSSIKLIWPRDLPRGSPRPESIVAICTSVPVDVSSLSQEGIKGRAPDDTSSILLHKLKAIGSGMRDLEVPADEVIPYRIERLDFLLQPGSRPDLSEPSFFLDQRPDLSLRVLQPRAFQKPPTAVAVRLRSLVVRRNRALFSANIRVDTLAVTRPKPGARTPSVVAETNSFPRIGAGDQLPFEALRVYYGPVNDFLDLAVWVSRDDRRGASLAELFSKEMNTADLKTALAAIAGVAIAQPQVGLAVGAVAGISVLVRTAARLIDAAVNKSVGVYRTSLMAYEQFGLGVHPGNGLLDAQDMALSYEVIAVDQAEQG